MLSTPPAPKACGQGSTSPRRGGGANSRCGSFAPWPPMADSTSRTSPAPTTNAGGDMGSPRRHRNPLRTNILAALSLASAPLSTAQLCRTLPDLPLDGSDRCYPAVHEHVYRQLVALERAGIVSRESTRGRNVLWALLHGEGGERESVCTKTDLNLCCLVEVGQCNCLASYRRARRMNAPDTSTPPAETSADQPCRRAQPTTSAPATSSPGSGTLGRPVSTVAR